MTVREILLTRRGVVFVDSTGTPAAKTIEALELELAAIGYVMSTRLRARVATASLDELTAMHAWMVKALLEHKGGGRKHEPLFRQFPYGVPDDTAQLWWKRVLVHFIQAPNTRCLFCAQVGTTHVMSECKHVVCDHCFDGANYAACPVCGHHADRTSPFFKEVPPRDAPKERVTFQVLDLGTTAREESKTLFLSLCARTQAMSPQDRAALVTVLTEYRGETLAWLPTKIPVRENIAVVFGTLFQVCKAEDVLPHAKRFMTTTTDVLRFVHVISGQDGSLQMTSKPVYPPKLNYRFKVAKMSRALRRTLLTILEGFDAERLVEDMLRHDSMWVWVGEFLHPGEYKARFPNVMHAFDVVRKEAKAQTWASRVAIARGDQLVALLRERPGEFGRKLDHVLRTSTDASAVIAQFPVDKIATPMLVGLHAHFPRRTQRAPIRVYWPQSEVATGVSESDKRPLLAPDVVAQITAKLSAELLARFATKPRFASAIVDEELRNVIVPFNERTASKSAVNLPRGSRVAIGPSKWIRMFMHWCEPQRGYDTDLDLSIGFYDSAWKHTGVCSYYQLSLGDMAKSSGDYTDAPFPDGASEFVDLERARAKAAGHRYAVMVVNAYSGMTFDQLERAFAGVMLRDDADGKVFDPRTVALRFALTGEHGVYLPCVIDLETDQLHWLDVHSPGQFQFNNVANSSRAITRICPDIITYFATGTRASMYELALFHAAARTDRVFVRGESTKEFVRRSGESIADFHARLVVGEADEPRSRLRTDEPALAILYRGDVSLADGSASYALFREQVTPTLAAADLLV
ncbi:MAG: hypothetical protein QM831_17140 [Kofleriaceae bacterium]